MPEHLEPFRQLAATRLERVSFGMDRFSTNDLDEDIQLIMATCPHLEALELKLVLHDHDIALILDTITSLITELTVPIGSAIFGGASRGSMGFQTLSKIKAYMLAAKDIRNGPGTWVCKGLESFQISISGFRDPLADVVRKAVLRRFAALPRLRVLEIGAENGTIMSLKYGLGQLSGLTQLTRVSIEPTRQSMRREEVEWIRNHWTNLTTLKGCLHDRHEISEAIREVLTARGQGGGGGRRGIERILKAEAVLDQFAFHVVGHRY
ncbi:hypothetical protein FBU30_005461 [Linnemannia zychae]|nr:hypothetical protein FBU30_005461 [Linnemannia zychae]